MGLYVNVKANSGFANDINLLWNELFDGHLIYTPKIIKNEIDFIKKNQPSLAYIKTIKDWNESLPILAQNKGQVFIENSFYSGNNLSPEGELAKKKIEFILENRMMFKTITNIQEAVESLGITADYDCFINGKMKKAHSLDFKDAEKYKKNPVVIKTRKQSYRLLKINK